MISRGCFCIPCKYMILLIAFTAGFHFCLAQQDSIPVHPSRSLSIGSHRASYILGGGYGLSLAYIQDQIEVGFGAEIDNYRYGGMFYTRLYLNNLSRLAKPFGGFRIAHYYDAASIGLRPSYSWNFHLSLGLKLRLYRSFWLQGQLGSGYSGFFRPGGKPIFVPTWVPVETFQYGICYDIPLQEQTPSPQFPQKDAVHYGIGARFFFLFHVGIPINILAPPAINRFTAGLGFDLSPPLALTARHQAIRTFAGLKYGKTQVGLRWMPGHRNGLRWIGSLEAGHVGSILNPQSPIGAIGITAGQHLQYPLKRWGALDAGFQYSWMKAPQPLQPSTTDFEINLGLVVWPGRF